MISRAHVRAREGKIVALRHLVSSARRKRWSVPRAGPSRAALHKPRHSARFGRGMVWPEHAGRPSQRPAPLHARAREKTCDFTSRRHVLMPRVRIGPALPDRVALDVEIAHLRDLDGAGLRGRWHGVFGRRPPPHLARHLLFRILAYRFQADRLGDLDDESRRLLDGSGSPEKAGKNAANLVRHIADVRPGTSLGREWNGRMQRVAVLAEGFSWNGKTYPSLSQVAFAITGTRWNGPRFFGLRDKPSKLSSV